MIPSSRKLEGFVLVLVISVSAYLTVVQLVNGLGFDGLIESFTVNVSTRSGSDNQYAINEVFAIKVECRRANAYRLRFYHAGSLVYEKYGSVSVFSFNASASLVPPAFSAGNAYLAVLDVYVYNEPLLGASFSKSVSHVFAVGQTETRLKFTGLFDGCSRELRLVANLTDVDGHPVVNETVDFGMLMSKRRHVTDDWEPLVSAVTNASGLADTGMALSIPSTNYTVRAHHNANENFGESEHILTIPIFANETFWGFLGCQSESLLVCGSGRVVISVPSFSVYALLKINVGVTYYSDTPSTQDGPFYAFFFRDYLNFTGYVGCTRLALHLGQYPEDPWTGTGSIGWTPRILGNHKLICLVVNSTGHTIGSTDVSMYVAACPSNVVTHLPEAIYSNDTDITVAVAMPRRYNVTSAGGFISTSLASKFAYNGGTYAIDDLAESTPVDLYVNGSWIARNFTDQEGLASFSHRLTFAGSHCRMYLRTVVNGSITLYQGWNTTQDLCFTKVNVMGSPGGIVEQFRLNSTFMNSTQVAEPIYVGVNKTVEATTQLFGLPVYDSPVSALIGKLRARYCSDGNGSVQKPNLTDFIRVVAVYNISETKATATLDFIRDGIVDLKEVNAVGRAFGTIPGDAKWDWRADVILDWKIDLKDYFAVAKYYGDQVRYLDVMDHSSLRVSLYNNGAWVGETFADSDGCVWLPATGVTEIKLTLGGKLVGGVVEFFNKACHFDDVTNNAGEIRFSWVPEETAVVGFMIQGGNLPYFLSVWLPKHFTVFTDRWDPVTEVVSALSVVKLLDVLKRPVNLTVDMPCSFNVTVVEAVADASVYSNDANGRHGSENGLYVGGGGGTVYGERISYLGFNISAFPAGAYVVSARLNVFLCDIVDDYHYGFTEYGVHRVTGSWDEATVSWSNRPSYVLEPSCFLTLGYPGGDFWDDWRWLVFDVTEDVRLWHGGSAVNYGFALDRNPSTQQYLLKLGSRESCFSVRPRLEVSYISPLPELVLNAYDSGAKKPVDTLHVDVLVNGTLAGHGSTNSSGLFSVADWRPSANRIFNVTALSAGNDTLLAGRACVFLDLRFPTNITSYQGNPIGVLVGGEAKFKCQLSSPYPCGLEATLNYYINGSSPSGEQYCYRHCETTYPWGNLTIRWSPPWGGLFYMRTVFNGSSSYKPCEAAALINASVTPLAILFSVSPNDFGVGRTIVLNATVMNAVTNMRLTTQSASVQFFKVDQYGHNCTIGNSTTINGVALREYYYWDSQAYAFIAKIQSYETQIPQCMVSSPVQLTVATSTRLLLNVSNDGTEHTIKGWLKYNSTGVVGEKVTVKVNETATQLTTGTAGFFSFTQDLRPTDNKPTMYTVTVSYNGSTPQNATALAYAADGQRYAACTMIYFGYKPSANATTLRVDAQATEAMTATENPPAPAGWLQLWGPDSFSIFPPFFKFHAKVSIDWLDMVIHSWIGLFSCGVDAFEGLVGLLESAMDGLNPAQAEVAISLVISVATTIITLFSLSMIAASLAQITFTGYIATWIAYTCALSLAILFAYCLADVGISRTVLYGIGFALLGLTVAGFWNDPQARIFPTILRQQLVGGDPIMTAVKFIVNSFVNTGITASYMLAASIIFKNPLMWPFAISTFGMALLAINLGRSR